MPRQTLAAELVREMEDLLFPPSTTLVSMSIYAVLELPQELYFGMRSEKNRNLLEVAEVQVDDGGVLKTLVKPYFSPNKQKGLERRAIAYSLVGSRGVPYYRFFNLSIDVSSTYPDGRVDPRDILTFLYGAVWTSGAHERGRIGHGGGVGVQPLVSEKERVRLEYNMYNVSSKKANSDTAQTVWEKEYAPPHLLVPVIRHGFLLGVENYEPHALAYAFLAMQRLAGAGTPKSVVIFETFLRDDGRKEKLLVVDVGRNLLPEPVVFSPAITHPSEAISEFRRKALGERRATYMEFDPDRGDDAIDVVFSGARERPVRLVGDDAYEFLYELAARFDRDYLAKLDDPKSVCTPRMRAGGLC